MRLQRHLHELVGGSYFDQEDSFDRHVVMVGQDNASDGITSDKIYGLDLSDEGSISFQLDTEATKRAIVERIGIDLDETKRGIRGIQGYQPTISSSRHQNTNDTNLTFEFGASDIPSNNPTYSSATTFDMAADYKIDSRAAGRYLSYRVTVSDQKDFELSGFDLEVTATGKR